MQLQEASAESMSVTQLSEELLKHSKLADQSALIPSSDAIYDSETDDYSDIDFKLDAKTSSTRKRSTRKRTCRFRNYAEALDYNDESDESSSENEPHRKLRKIKKTKQGRWKKGSEKMKEKQGRTASVGEEKQSIEQGDEKDLNRTWSVSGRTCSVCGKIFTRADSLKVHMRIHSGVRPFQCSRCEATYKVSSHLRNHIRSKHTTSRPFACSKCGKDFAYPTARNRHQKVCGVDLSERVQFECRVCNREFVTLKGYKKHVDKAACSSDPIRQKMTESDPFRHNFSESERDKAVQCENVDLKLKTKDGRFQFRCAKCKKEFDEISGLECHRRFLCGLLATGPYKCPECEREYDKRYRYIVHAHHHAGYRPFKCSQCQATFMERTTWRRHVISHERPKKKLPCSLCEKAFTNKQKLSVHMMRIHCGMKPFKCHECSKDFAGPRDLSIHIRRVHRKERPYTCALCSRAFFGSHAWMKHMITHAKTAENSMEKKSTEEKSTENGSVTKIGILKRSPRCYHCNLCQKPFTLQNMRQHVTTEHPGVTLSDAVTSKYFLTCDVCSKEFSSKESLQVHKKRHAKGREFQCPECRKMFMTEAYLKCHQRKHSDVHPYQCPQCPKAFRWKASYTEHLKYTHSAGTDSNVCQHCGKKFKRSDNLKCHMIRHRSVLPCVCSACGKGFVNNTRLRIHMSMHKDNDENPRPYICEMCGAGYFYGFLLKRHVSTKHTPNQALCNICGKALCNKDVLKKHIALHSQSPDGNIRKGRAAHAFKFGVGVIKSKKTPNLRSNKESTKGKSGAVLTENGAVHMPVEMKVVQDGNRTVDNMHAEINWTRRDEVCYNAVSSYEEQVLDQCTQYAHTQCIEGTTVAMPSYKDKGADQCCTHTA